MSPKEHKAKAARIEKGLQKLQSGEDGLAIIDGAMVAGFHWGNAILHRCGVLPEGEHANTPSKLSMAIPDLPAAAQAPFRAFAELEKLRFDYVRNAGRYEGDIGRNVWSALEVLRNAADG